MDGMIIHDRRQLLQHNAIPVGIPGLWQAVSGDPQVNELRSLPPQAMILMLGSKRRSAFAHWYAFFA